MKKSSENRLLSANGTFFVPDGARRGRACGASHPIANPPSRGICRGSVQYSRSSRTGLFLVKLFLSPRENRRDGIVPDRSDDDAGKAGEPPDLVLGKDIAGDADIGDRTEGANRIKSEKPPQ